MHVTQNLSTGCISNQAAVGVLGLKGNTKKATYRNLENTAAYWVCRGREAEEGDREKQEGWEQG